MKWLFAITSPLILIDAAVAQQNSISQLCVTDVLRARLIAVVPYSQARSADDSQENERARIDTKQALLKWGKYQVTDDPTMADLIVVVRKGRSRSNTIDTGNPSGVILYPSDGGVTIGGHRGQTPPLSRNPPSTGQRQPGVGQEVGSADDNLEVYLGGTPRIGDASRDKTQYPLDQPPIWSYTAPDSLKSPRMEAVAKFRQAVETAQKKNP